MAPTRESDLVGLAFSGGGIRSAAVCLGVLQALQEGKVFGKVDYLSTVSGGGYIGCSLTAAMQGGAAQGYPGFPFTSALHEDEPPALQHIRDHSICFRIAARALIFCAMPRFTHVVLSSMPSS
jgi:hypothetical protein